MRNEAVIMPNWIGDFLLALSVVEGARRGGREATLIVPGHLVPLLRLVSDAPHRAIDREDFGGFYRVVAGIRRRPFDTVYVLPHSFSSALLAFLCGAAHRRGVVRNHRQFLLNDALPRSTRTSLLHITEEYAAVLRTAQVPPSEWPGKRIESGPRAAGKVVFCPGADYGPAKKWTGFGELAALMDNERIVLLGSEREAETAGEIARRAPERIENLSGKTAIEEAARIIAGSKLVVSNDSGLMHAAGYLGVPVVGIFGSTRPSWTRPLGKNVRVAYEPTECSPCFERTCRYGHYRCLGNIRAPQVLGLVRELCG
jgi:heptosyltransferase-2